MQRPYVSSTILLLAPALARAGEPVGAGWEHSRELASLAVMVMLVGALAVVVFLRRQVVGRNGALKGELRERAALEARLTEMVESAADAIFTLDDGGRVLTFNAAGERLTGRPRADVIGGEFRTLLAYAPAAVDWGLMRREPTRFEMRVHSPVGPAHVWEVSSRPAARPAGAVEVHCVARDVTARAAADDELRRLCLVQTQQLENSPLAFIEWDADFRVAQWSRRAEEIFGWPAAAAVGRTMDELELVHPGDRAAVGAVAAAMLSGERPTTHSANRNLTRDGLTVHIEWYNSARRDAAGRFRSLVSLAQDVSARVAAEENRRRLEDQVRQSQKMEAVGRLAGGVAHDFNNLLTVINGCSELLLRETRAGEAAHDLGIDIRAAGEQAAGLTRQLLAFARREVTAPAALGLNKVVQDVEKMLRRLIGEHIELATDLDPDAGRVKADPNQMVQLLMNLAVNARDAMPRGGRLTVRTRAAGPDQVLEVQDTGAGMDAATKARIFEPFFTTKPAGQATGIGLATVHGIVEAAGGSITADSEVGAGTTFRIVLPTCNDRPPAKTTGYSRRPDLTARETILLVEDEDLVRALAQRVLEGKGYRVFTAPCPADALTLFDTLPGRVDLLLSDVVMPGMGGRELAEKLRDARPDLKVLFMSGYTADEVLLEGVREDAVHFLQKPFTTDGLQRKVRDVLAAPVLATATA